MNKKNENIKTDEIIVDGLKYQWNSKENGYFKSYGSLGQDGAILHNDKWYPAHIDPDSIYGAEIDDDYEFENLHEAIEKARSCFS